ncbi:MAG TPA: glycosyltransferase family 39 protein [Longimicrobiales bacterium]
MTLDPATRAAPGAVPRNGTTAGPAEPAAGAAARADRSWPLALAAAVFLAHLAVVAGGPYGPHRDALLYYAMGEHLHLFAMDFPPFIAIVARATTAFGNIELLTHLPVAAAHATLILLAAAFARRAGGGTGASAIAAVSIATAPVFMRAGSLFQPVVFDQLWWTAALWSLARLGRSADTPTHASARSWLLLGAFLGLGLLTKFTMLVLGAGIFVAIAATPLRRSLRTPWPWAAALLAFAIASPGILGQIALDWPFLTQFQDLADAQLSRISPASFVAEQLLLLGPVAIPVAFVTVTTLLKGGDPGLRAVAWAAAAAFVLMLLAGGKPYYIAPIWPALTGIAIGRIDARLGRTRAGAGAGTGAPVTSSRLRRRIVHATLWLLVAGWGLVTLPLGLPFLPPAPMSRYAAFLGVGATSNTGEQLALPQDYADMLGWEDLAAATDSAWRALTAAERGRAVILATNYGRAGAIDWFGSADLPPAIAPVGSYWFWGPGERPGAITIVVGEEADELAGRWFRSATEFTRVRRPWGVPEEQDVPIVIARDPVRTLKEIWPEFRGVN